LVLPEGPKILACWHQDLLPMFVAAHRLPSLALVSGSRDADLLRALLATTPVRVVRGSSSHGQAAVRSLLSHLREGGTVIMAMDGPRGPALEEKSGTAWLARQGRAALVRMEFEVSRCIRLSDWSRLRLPLPGAVVRTRTSIFGAP
jgi:lysophospholipid acyltransferase (LPLAT)-like uncharacterized protein